MKQFLTRHKVVHIWSVLLVLLFGFYRWTISHVSAANAVVSVTQRIKDGYACLWYLFPFSVVEWMYVGFILLTLLLLTAVILRIRKSGEKLHTAYGGFLSILCLRALKSKGQFCRGLPVYFRFKLIF